MGLKYNPFTGSFDFTGVAPSTLSNYVLKAGDTMTGRLLLSPSASQSNGSFYLLQNANTSNNGLRVATTNTFNHATLWLNGSGVSILDATGSIALNGSNSGFVGINTVNPTHTLTLPSTATGIALYNTSDQTTNYERVRQYWSGDAFYIYSQSGGTGVARPILLKHTYNMVDVQLAVNRAGTTDTAFVSVNQGGLTTVSNVSILKLFGTAAHSSSKYYGLSIVPTINQSSTAGYTALLINPTEASTGSGAKLLIDAQVGGISRFQVRSSGAVFALGSDGVTNIYINDPSAPDKPLQINGNHVFEVRLFVNNNGAGNSQISYAASGTTRWSNGYRSSDGSYVIANGYSLSSSALAIIDTTGHLGIGSTAPTAFLDIRASVSGSAHIRLRAGTAPTSPNDGDIWYDGTDLKMRVGGTTKTFQLV